MNAKDSTLRHLLDLCRKSERAGIRQYSGFLSPAEQDDFLRCPEAAEYTFSFLGGYEAAERKILAAGNEDAASCPPDARAAAAFGKTKSPAAAISISRTAENRLFPSGIFSYGLWDLLHIGFSCGLI